LISRLVDDGLLVREADPNDRRASRAAITADGRRELMTWDAAHRRRIRPALRALPDRDRAAILAALPALDRLAEALNDDA